MPKTQTNKTKDFFILAEIFVQNKNLKLSKLSQIVGIIYSKSSKTEYFHTYSKIIFRRLVIKNAQKI